MPATVEEFKSAFGLSVADDLLTRRDEQAATALKALQKSVAGLTDPDSAKRHKEELVELVRCYDGIKKKADRPRSEVVADLEGVCRAVIAQLSELKQAASSTAVQGNAAPLAPLQTAAPTTSEPAKTTATETAEDGAPDLRKEFRAARQGWVKAREKAVEDLEAVKDAACSHYLDDPKQLPIVLSRLKELDEIMDNVSDDLRDVLDAYVATRPTQRQRVEELATQAKTLLDSFVAYVDQSSLLTAIDQKEFADVTVRAPIKSALKKLAGTIR